MVRIFQRTWINLIIHYVQLCKTIAFNTFFDDSRPMPLLINVKTSTCMYRYSMATIPAVIFIAIVATVLCQRRIIKSENELKLLHVIFRHGVRTPADTYPTDPYLNYDFQPFGWGQLTNSGKLQMYNLGKYLRERYDSYLGDLYSSDVCYIQTTDVDRTKMSAQCISAGLWPPNNLTKFGPLNWQPISFNSEPLKQDSLLLVRTPCPQYSIEREQIENSDEVQRVYEQNQELFRQLSRYTGREVKNAEDILDLQGTLSAEMEFNLTLPDWANNLYNSLIPIAEYAFVLNTKNKKLQRLKGGVLLKKILNDYLDVVENKLKPSNRRLFLYGGHDSTIANLLSVLQVWDPQIPSYGATIIFELRQTLNNDFGLQIFFKNETNSDPYPLIIPGCDFFCPLNKLIELTESVIPTDWNEECKTDIDGYVPPPPSGP